MSYTEYINKRLLSLQEKLKVFHDAIWSLNKIAVTLEFFVVEVDNTGECFVLTGNREKPEGISIIHDAYIAFSFNKKLLLVIDDRVIKEFISRRENVKLEIETEHYKSLGARFKLRDLVTYIENISYDPDYIDKDL